MSVAWPKHIAGDEGCCWAIDVHLVNVIGSVSDMNVQATGIAVSRNQSLDSFLGVGVALASVFPESVFPESVFAESDVVAVEVSLAFFAASAPFL